jgi:serine/threonine protein kinase
MNSTSVRIFNNRYAAVSAPKQGGMAEVYKAVDSQADGNVVAVKVFRTDVLDDELAREAFRRETEAVRSCNHPNIVRLLDTGVEEASGRSFLVLEWLPRNLEEMLNAEGPQDWDRFYSAVGRPILDALALTHARQIVHRDLKPANILLDPDGTPKIADFSIAKLKRWRDAGVTLGDFASHPYAAPEARSGASYDGDLFSYAALTLRCLSSVPLRDYEDLQAALKAAAAPEDVKDVLRTCLASQDERPAIAGMLLAKLDELHRNRSRRDRLRRPLHIVLSGRAREQLFTDWRLADRKDVERSVVEDLSGLIALSRISPPKPKRQFDLFGAECLYEMVLPLSQKDHLIVENARRATPGFLEFRRDKGMALHCDIKLVRPTRSREAAEALEELLGQIDNFDAERRLEESWVREHELFGTWLNVLRAKGEVEHDRQPELPYVSLRLEGRVAFFELEAPPPAGIIGQPRQLKRERRVLLTGEIEAVQDTTIVLRIVEQNDADLPSRGKLTFDVTLARIALERQWGAVDAIRYLRCARPKLRDLLVFPSESQPPGGPDRDIDFCQPNLATDKAEAVRTALNAPDFLLVEGPPGTGKTTFITEVILQVLAANPVARILLTSQTHVALDHVLDALRRTGRPLAAVRIGRSEDERITGFGQTLLIGRRLEQWREEALNSGQNFLATLAADAGVSLNALRLAARVRSLLAARRRAAELERRITQMEDSLARLSAAASLSPATQVKAMSQSARALADEIDHDRGELHSVTALMRSVAEEITAHPDAPRDIRAAREDEIEIWVTNLVGDDAHRRKLRVLAEVFSEWETRCGRSQEFEAPFLSSVQVVAATCLGVEASRGTREIEFDLCIIDEASKATPTEVLVPLSKSRRWILVGDDKQLPPFLDRAVLRPERLEKYDLTEESLRETLFTYLKKGLPDECHVELRRQHRMVPAIGKLISHCFYDGRLENDERNWDRTFADLLPKPVVWWTTARLQNRGESAVEGSFANAAEVRVIDHLLARIQAAAGPARRPWRIGVITGYSAQKQSLERMIARHMNNPVLKIECNTVDAFQGREVDIVIYSVTRSNLRRKLGFLGEMRRLNVALSRGREYLVIVGDHHFCRNAADPNPIRSVLTYIRDNPDDCVLKDATR